MLNNLVSLISNSLTTTTSTQITPVKTKTGYNPFAATDNQNPFLGSSFTGSSSYGKNTPVSGGYFAGYYNGKPNIVGRKLFIEV